MTLGEGFARQDLVEKHGNKGRPGYHLLHPGRVKGATHGGTGNTAGDQKAVNQRKRVYGAAIQTAMKKPAGPARDRALNNILNRVQNDSLLDTKDFDQVLNELEAAHRDGKGASLPDAPKAKTPAPRKAPAKAPAQGPGLGRAQADAVNRYRKKLGEAKSQSEIDRLEQAIENDPFLNNRLRNDLALDVNAARDNAGPGPATRQAQVESAARRAAKAPAKGVATRRQARVDNAMAHMADGDPDKARAVLRDLLAGVIAPNAAQQKQIEARLDEILKPKRPPVKRAPNANRTSQRRAAAPSVKPATSPGLGNFPPTPKRRPSKAKQLLQRMRNAAGTDEARGLMQGTVDQAKFKGEINTADRQAIVNTGNRRMNERAAARQAGLGLNPRGPAVQPGGRRGPDPARPDAPNVIGVEVDETFNDPAAMDAVLDKMQDDLGRKMFDPARGDVIYMRGRGAPAKEFKRKAEARGFQVRDLRAVDTANDNRAILRRMANKARVQGGRRHIIALRPEGGTLVSRSRLAEMWAVDPTIREGEGALVVNPGYKGRRNRAGEEIDSKAFGLNADDVGAALPAVGRARGAAAPAPAPARPRNSLGDPNKPADGPDGNWVDDGPPWPAPIRTGTPAANHFKNGGTLADAPEDGLFDFIFQQNGTEGMGFHMKPGQKHSSRGSVGGNRPAYTSADPDKFRVVNFGGHGISANYIVTELDKDGNPLHWRMFKGSTGYHVWDAHDEVIINDFLRRMGVEVPKVQFARNPNHRGPSWMASEHAGKVVPGFDEKNPGGVRIGDAGGGGNRGRLRKYRDGVLMMDILDWIIENPDRHGGNWMIAEMPDGGAKPVIIDNGGGFVNGARNRALPAGRHGVEHYRGDDAGLVRDIDKIQTMLRGVDVREMLDVYRNGRPGLPAATDPDYQKHLEDLQGWFDMKVNVLLGARPEDIAQAYSGRR